MVTCLLGWDLTLEYMISSAAVARGWSGYLRHLLEVMGLRVPDAFNHIVVGAGVMSALCVYVTSYCVPRLGRR